MKRRYIIMLIGDDDSLANVMRMADLIDSLGEKVNAEVKMFHFEPPITAPQVTQFIQFANEGVENEGPEPEAEVVSIERFAKRRDQGQN